MIILMQENYIKPKSITYLYIFMFILIAILKCGMIEQYKYIIIYHYYL